MKILRLIPVLFVLLASAVMAEIPTFKKLDINKDELLSKYEMELSVVGYEVEISVIDIDITSADKDYDGALNEEEYASFIKKLHAKEL